MDLELHITGRGLELSEAMKAKVTDKLAAAIAPMCDDPATTVHVELVRENRQPRPDQFACRVQVALPGEAAVVTHEVDDNLYAAVDLVQERLLELVRERKDRHRNHHQAQKQAERDRGVTARDSMTDLGERRREPEQWEKETAAFEKAQDKDKGLA